VRHVVVVQVGILLMEAVDITNRPDYIEAFPGPIQVLLPLTCNNPLVTGLDRSLRRQVVRSSALYALHLEGLR
jgi:hypothetical protein